MVCAFCYKQMISALTSIVQIILFAKSFEEKYERSLNEAEKYQYVCFYMGKGEKSTYFNKCTFLYFCLCKYRQDGKQETTNFRSHSIVLFYRFLNLFGCSYLAEWNPSVHYILYIHTLYIFSWQCLFPFDHIEYQIDGFLTDALLNDLYFFLFLMFGHYLFHFFFLKKNANNGIAFFLFHKNRLDWR